MKLKIIFSVLIALSSILSFAVSKKSESFGTGLLKSMSIFSQNNWVISPVSIKSVLEELYIGAGGKTKEELGSVLDVSNNAGVKNDQAQFNDSPHDGVVWKRANRILVKDSFPLKDSFKSQLISVFNAEVESTDFIDSEKAANSINSWVSNSTEGLISHLVDPGDMGPSNIMVLLNAVYFQGTWKYAFEESETKEKCFYPHASKCSKVQMMEQKGLHKYGDNLEIDAKFLQLPYNDPMYTMVIVLPNKHVTPSTIFHQMSLEKLLEYIKNMSDENIDMSIPKFKSNFKVTLNEPLQKVGISSIFDTTADFSDMTDASGMYVSHMIHEAHLSLTEKGTIAAASTGVIMARTLISEPPEYVKFIADHPFFYFILYNNTQLLFAGQYSG